MNHSNLVKEPRAPVLSIRTLLATIRFEPLSCWPGHGSRAADHTTFDSLTDPLFWLTCAPRPAKDPSRGSAARRDNPVVESPQTKGIKQRQLPKRDQGFSACLQGRVLVKVDSRGTTCVCGAQVPKTLTDRWNQCPACGLWAPRDVVSAQVILQRARIGRSRPNVEDVVSCVPREGVAFQA